jgi:sugar phosphate isomerase/epimerase
LDIAIGLSGYDFKSASLPQLADIAVDVGADALELWPGNISGLGFREIRRVVKKRGLTTACINASAEYRVHGPIDLREIRRHLLSCVELADAVGAALVNVYVGPTDDDQLARTMHALEPVLAAAEQANVSLVVENHFDNRNEDPECRALARTPEGVFSLWRASGGRLGNTFDPANFLIAGVEPFPFAYCIVRDAMRYVHIKGVTRLHGNNQNHLTDSHQGSFGVVAAGGGAINYSGLLGALIESGFDGVLMVEPHVAERDALESASETITYLHRELTALSSQA